MKNKNLLDMYFDVSVNFINGKHILEKIKVVEDINNAETNIKGQSTVNPKDFYAINELGIKFGKFYK